MRETGDRLPFEISLRMVRILDFRIAYPGSSKKQLLYIKRAKLWCPDARLLSIAYLTVFFGPQIRSSLFPHKKEADLWHETCRIPAPNRYDLSFYLYRLPCSSDGEVRNKRVVNSGTFSFGT